MAPLVYALFSLAPTLLKYLTNENIPKNVVDVVTEVAKTVTKANNTEDALMILQQSPADLVKFKEVIANKDLQLHQLYLADVQNARARDVEIIKTVGVNTRGDVLAYGALAALLIDLFIISFVNLNSVQEKLAFSFLGSLFTIVSLVYNFEFGTSKNSEERKTARDDMFFKKFFEEEEDAKPR